MHNSIGPNVGAGFHFQLPTTRRVGRRWDRDSPPLQGGVAVRINFLINCAQTGRLVMSLQIHRNTTNHPVCAFKGSELF